MLLEGEKKKKIPNTRMTNLQYVETNNKSNSITMQDSETWYEQKDSYVHNNSYTNRSNRKSLL